MAISDRVGTQDIHISESVTGHSLVADRYRSDGKIKVYADILDSVVCGDIPIDFAKIDVQGAETRIWKTAHQFLSTVRKLVVETHDYGNPEKQTFTVVLRELMPYFNKIETNGRGIIYGWKQ